MQTIHAEHITKIYSSRSKQPITALSGFSLSVSGGEIFGLLGPNGAGKTTFIKILLSIAFPTSGTANVLGEPIGDVETKRAIGYLPENHRYPPYLTGEGVLRYFGKLSGITGHQLDTRISEVLSLVGMSKWNAVKVRKYSKGMMQRIGLAQALINDPKLVFLDEPTDGVDPVGRKEIREILGRLRNEGRTVFLNSHLLSEVELICDRVAIVNHGKFVRGGTVKELTEDKHRFAIGIHGPLPDALRIQWEATRTSIEEENGALMATVAGVDELNAIIDQLRSHGVLIESVTSKKSTLEDFFITVLKGES